MATSINHSTTSTNSGYALAVDDRLFVNEGETGVFNAMSLAAHFGLVEEKRYVYDETTITTWSWKTDHGQVYSMTHQAFNLSHPDYDPEDINSAYLSTDEFADISTQRAVRILRDLPNDVRRQAPLLPWQRAAYDALIVRIAI